MYKYIFIGFLSVMTCQKGVSQVKYLHPPSIGIHLTFNQFDGVDSGFHYVSNTAKWRTGLALNYTKGISGRADLDVILQGSFQRLNHPTTTSGQQLFLETDVAALLYLLPATRHINPFIRVGGGLFKISDYYGVHLPVGAGLRVTLPGETILCVQFQDRLPAGSGTAEHLQFSIGIAGIIGKWRKIKEPTTRQVPVVAQAHPGGKDTDGDGIVDSLDACPTIPGSVHYNGCPIPDRDKDGVNDEEDKCPDLPGDRRNQGCPVLAKAIRKRAEWDARNVFFQTDSSTILAASEKALHEVAETLRQDPALRLDIEGHTDNTGTDQWNRELSQRRADAVLQFLVNRESIDARRLHAEGFGSSRPVAENSSVAGKAANRRVEFKLRYY